MSIELNVSFKEEEGITREFKIYIIARHTCNNYARMADASDGLIKKRG